MQGGASNGKADCKAETSSTTVAQRLVQPTRVEGQGNSKERGAYLLLIYWDNENTATRTVVTKLLANDRRTHAFGVIALALVAVKSVRKSLE